MKRSPALILALLFSSGCQTAQLQHSTLQQSGSVTNLYYSQVMNNIAMLDEDPGSLPYFSQPQTGQTTVQYSIAVGATSEWDLISAAGALFARFVFAKQSGVMNGTDTNIEAWNTAPTLVPNKILLMKYAYECAFGNREHFVDLQKVLDAEYKYNKATEKDPEEISKNIAKAKKEVSDLTKRFELEANPKEKALLKSMKADAEDKLMALEMELSRPQSSLAHFAIPYTTMLHSGWFETGRRHQVPRKAKYVGHCGKTYAWVRPGDEDRFAEFTLVILDIATFEAPDREKRASPPGNMNKSAK